MAHPFVLPSREADVPHPVERRTSHGGVVMSEPASEPTNEREPLGAEKLFGDFAPALVHFTDDVLFAEVWERTDLSPKERSLVTVAALTALGNVDQLNF